MSDTPEPPDDLPRLNLDEIDARQDEILAALDALNERILRALAEQGVKMPQPAAAWRADKAA
jgi:hypothetical protein